MDQAAGPAGTNWAGNHTYAAGRYVRARSLAEAQDVVAASRRVRSLGTRHSFNALCDTEGTLLDLTGLTTEPVVDPAAGSVRVAGGTTYRDLATHLHAHGLALANLGSLPHISVAGAVATGTHGSGAGNRILASSVRRLELIGPDGALRTVTRGEPDFDGSLVALGALGPVVTLDLDVQPTYDVRQDLYDHLVWGEVVERVGDVLGAGYSVSVFGRWSDAEPTDVLVKTRTDADAGPPDWAGDVAPVAPDAPFRSLGEGHLTVRGTPGPWFERLPHFRGDRQPSFGEEIQTEWFVDAVHAREALRAVTSLAAATQGRLADLLIVTELRAVRGDDLWLSPTQGRDVVALHFTWRRQSDAVLEMVRLVEATLEPWGARPHWGKVHDRVDDTLYPGLVAFRGLADRVDPDGTFRNPTIDRLLTG